MNRIRNSRAAIVNMMGSRRINMEPIRQARKLMLVVLLIAHSQASAHQFSKMDPNKELYPNNQIKRGDRMFLLMHETPQHNDKDF